MTRAESIRICSSSRFTGQICRITGIVIAVVLVNAFRSSVLSAPSVENSVSSAEVTVFVGPEVEVAGEMVHLGDIAEIQAEDAVKNMLASLEIGPAPRPGLHRTWQGRRISAAVHSVSMPDMKTRVVAPEIIRVTRAGQTVTEDALNLFLAEQLESVLQPDDTLSRLAIRGGADFPVGALTMELAEYAIDGRQRLQATVNVQVEGNPVGQLKVKARINSYSDIVCSRQALAKGAILSADNVYLKRIQLERGAKRFIGTLDEAIGKELRQGVRPDGIIEANMLTNPTLIQKGDQVKIILESDLLKVATMGVAKDSGGMNEPIRVQGVDSERLLNGRVQDASTVVVKF